MPSQAMPVIDSRIPAVSARWAGANTPPEVVNAYKPARRGSGGASRARRVTHWPNGQSLDQEWVAAGSSAGEANAVVPLLVAAPVMRPRAVSRLPLAGTTRPTLPRPIGGMPE